VTSLASPPLAGVRVVDLTRAASGPICGRMLADMGAEVVNVEPPDGDTMRVTVPDVERVPLMYAQLNAGKRHVCIDLAVDGAGAEVRSVAELAETDWAREREVFAEVVAPGVRLPRAAWRSSAQTLGLSDAEIEGLQGRGVLKQELEQTT
jgi:crotonobetainyl-CoA:carnitine CoA-transferase CaiB-like acyl-CoA transferase